MSAHIRRVVGTNWDWVFCRCGERMLFLNTHQSPAGEASDWWCNRCAESVELLGDEESPRQMKPSQQTPQGGA